MDLLQQIKNANMAYLNLIVFAVGVFSIIVPSFIFDYQYHTNESTAINHLESVQLKVSGVALLISACPIVLDVLLDLFTKGISSKSKQCLIGRLCIGIVSFITAIIFVTENNYASNSYITIFWAGIWCARLTLFSSVMFSLCILKPTIFTVTQTTFVSVIAVFTANAKYHGYFSDSFSLQIASEIALFLWIISGVFFTCWWCYKLWECRRNWDIDINSCALYLILYVTIVFLGPSILFTLGILFRYTDTYWTPSGYSNPSLINILIPIYSQTVACIILCVVPGRIARLEVSFSKDQIISTKQAYVRYISHELRAPMNSVKMGLQHCISKIPIKSKNKAEKDHRDTLLEMGFACEVAIEILNDLLLYDKLENGLVTLKKDSIGAIDFITKCLEMFTVQIRAKHIKLELINVCASPNKLALKAPLYNKKSSQTSGMQFKRKRLAPALLMNHDNENNTDNTSSVSNNYNNTTTNSEYESVIENTDQVSVDRSKLGQVIRNIMSNAIKFTPAKGIIQVSIYFIKDDDKDNSLCTSNSNSSGKRIIYPLSYMSSLLKPHRNKIVEFFNRTNVYSVLQSDDPKQQSHTHKNSNSIRSVEAISEGITGNIDGDIESSRNTTTSILVPRNSETSTSTSSDDGNILREEKGMLVIDIKDSGAGISPENQKRLFKEIIQFNPEELQGGGGSGLGLFISKAIVDMHGGRLSVHSEGEGKGSTFRLEIPMTRLVVTDSPQGTANLGHSTNTLSLITQNQIFNPLQNDMFVSLSTECDDNNHNTSCSDDDNDDDSDNDSNIEESKDANFLIDTNNIKPTINLKLLVVDDSGTNRKFLCKLLAGRGHICDEAVDGLIAVDMVKNNMNSITNHINDNTASTSTRLYDAIFMDFVMPNLRGPDATIRIRKLGYTGPIIGLTGNAMQEDHDLFIQAGASNVLVKPLEMDRLLEIIDL